MEKRPGDKKGSDLFTLRDHGDKVEAERHHIENLAKTHQRLFTGYGIDCDDHAHDKSHVEGARKVHSVKEIRDHHQA